MIQAFKKAESNARSKEPRTSFGVVTVLHDAPAAVLGPRATTANKAITRRLSELRSQPAQADVNDSIQSIQAGVKREQATPRIRSVHVGERVEHSTTIVRPDEIAGEIQVAHARVRVHCLQLQKRPANWTGTNQSHRKSFSKAVFARQAQV